MAGIEPSNLKEFQRDILANNNSNLLNLNELLKSSFILAKDNKLKTISQAIIPAINELLKNTNMINSSFNSFNDSFVSALGDFKGHPEYLEQLQKVSPSVLQAIVQQYKELHGEDLVNPIQFNMEQSVAETLNQLYNNTIKEFECAEDIDKFKIIYITDNGKVKTATAKNKECANKVIGITLNNAKISEKVKVQVCGIIKIDDGSVLLSKSKQYILGEDGNLAISYLDDYFMYAPVGIAVSDNELAINIKNSIIVE